VERPFDTRFRAEQIAGTARLAPSATVRGDVWVGERSSIWFQAVVRGDTETVRIGAETNVQDACILHADPGYPCVLGDRVTVGHAAVVHGAQVEDDVMIGMRAVILNGARIGRGSIIGAGALVTEGTIIEPNSLVFGMPGKRVRETTVEQRDRIRQAAEHYVAAAQAFFGQPEPR
jgi:carbonic anhydrase/acetyltransferase-like protein (isoleucine patch superfamily)